MFQAQKPLLHLLKIHVQNRFMVLDHTRHSKEWQITQQTWSILGEREDQSPNHSEKRPRNFSSRGEAPAFPFAGNVSILFPRFHSRNIF